MISQVGVAALARDQVRTAQSALLGSILCYLLLVSLHILSHVEAVLFSLGS
jgi:hypothetical protein